MLHLILIPSWVLAIAWSVGFQIWVEVRVRWDAEFGWESWMSLTLWTMSRHWGPINTPPSDRCIGNSHCRYPESYVNLCFETRKLLLCRLYMCDKFVMLGWIRTELTHLSLLQL